MNESELNARVNDQYEISILNLFGYTERMKEMQTCTKEGRIDWKVVTGWVDDSSKGDEMIKEQQQQQQKE